MITVSAPYCGKNQSEVRRKEPKRPNGTGSIYIRKDNKSKPYAAASSLTGKQVYLGSFATRTEAVQALKYYEYNPVTSYNITLEQLHEEWQKIAYKKLGKSVQQNYNSAWYNLSPYTSVNFVISAPEKCRLSLIFMRLLITKSVLRVNLSTLIATVKALTL